MVYPCWGVVVRFVEVTIPKTNACDAHCLLKAKSIVCW